ncbi:uncharacterized protein CLUP02_08906 [Colletotrichum lupini]|uniref:Uncharacterized protein n=1 Tax=Colletotrichum lupini TaxID=145971 RepID=A0A9Q8SV54_9PEZI|nr:uncharacterized protein CLUP02_08906 [Colletotrichum lupini]UQC83411.1 hypothetical protein CLUP02_08906 [Colletotrichum lupini]
MTAMVAAILTQSFGWMLHVEVEVRSEDFDGGTVVIKDYPGHETRFLSSLRDVEADWKCVPLTRENTTRRYSACNTEERDWELKMYRDSIDARFQIIGPPNCCPLPHNRRMKKVFPHLMVAFLDTYRKSPELLLEQLRRGKKRLEMRTVSNPLGIPYVVLQMGMVSFLCDHDSVKAWSLGAQLLDSRHGDAQSSILSWSLSAVLQDKTPPLEAVCDSVSMAGAATLREVNINIVVSKQCLPPKILDNHYAVERIHLRDVAAPPRCNNILTGKSKKEAGLGYSPSSSAASHPLTKRQQKAKTQADKEADKKANPPPKRKRPAKPSKSAKKQAPTADEADSQHATDAEPRIEKQQPPIRPPRSREPSQHIQIHCGRVTDNLAEVINHLMGDLCLEAHKYLHLIILLLGKEAEYCARLQTENTGPGSIHRRGKGVVIVGTQHGLSRSIPQTEPVVGKTSYNRSVTMSVVIQS